MKQGPFISLISDALGVEVTRVKYIARCLREEGFMTSGARGVNAPDMTFLDAARLTITLMIDVPPKQAAKEYIRFHNLGILNGPDEGDGSFSHEVIKNCTGSFESFVAELFAVFADDGRLGPWQKRYQHKWNKDGEVTTYDPRIVVTVLSRPIDAKVEDWSIEAKGYDHLPIEFDVMGANEEVFAKLSDMKVDLGQLDIEDIDSKIADMAQGMMQDHYPDRTTKPIMSCSRSITHEIVREIARGMSADGMPPPYLTAAPDGDAT